MKEDKSISAFFIRVDRIVNIIRGEGEEVSEVVIVWKVLRSLPMRFNPKVFAIEESKDLNKLSMDELHGTLAAYEMRIEQGIKPTRREVVFKASKK